MPLQFLVPFDFGPKYFLFLGKPARREEGWKTSGKTGEPSTTLCSSFSLIRGPQLLESSPVPLLLFCTRQKWVWMRIEKHSTWKQSRTSLYYLSSTWTGCNNAFSKLNRQTNCNWCTVLKKGSLDSWRLDNTQSFSHLLLSCSNRLLVISVSILYNIRLNRWWRLGSPLVCHALYSKCLSSAGSLLLLLSNNSNGHFNSITSATRQTTQRPSSFL